MRRGRLVGLLLSVLLVGSMFAGGAAAQEDNRADLEIDQPNYIDDSVDVEQTGNATVYHVQGDGQTISPTYNASNITGYGTLDGPGTLSASGSGTWSFDPDGQEATTRVYFDVATGDGTERHVADIRVTNTDWNHVPAADYSEMQDELSAWQSLKQEAEGLVPGQDPSETLRDGLNYVSFFDSPLSSLREEMMGTVLMLTFTPGGLVIGGIILALVVGVLAKHYRYRNRTQKQFAELEDMQQEMDEAWLQKVRQRILQQCDLNEIFPDHLARAMRDYFGRDTWLAFKQYALLRSPTSIKGTWLQMMGQVGYSGQVEYDGSGNVVDARAVEGEVSGSDGRPLLPDEEDPSRDSHPGGWTSEVDLSDLSYEDDTDRRIIELIPTDDLDEAVFESEDIDASDVSFPIDNREVTDAELLEELDPDFPGDFDDREQFARALAKLMEFVANHNHTDEEGNVRREMDLVSFMMEMDSVLHDEADLANAYDMQKELIYAAEYLDKGERLHERVETAELDGISSTRQTIEFTGSAAGGD